MLHLLDLGFQEPWYLRLGSTLEFCRQEKPMPSYLQFFTAFLISAPSNPTSAHSVELFISPLPPRLSQLLRLCRCFQNVLALHVTSTAWYAPKDQKTTEEALIGYSAATWVVVSQLAYEVRQQSAYIVRSGGARLQQGYLHWSWHRLSWKERIAGIASSKVLHTKTVYNSYRHSAGVLGEVFLIRPKSKRLWEFIVICDGKIKKKKKSCTSYLKELLSDECLLEPELSKQLRLQYSFLKISVKHSKQLSFHGASPASCSRGDCKLTFLHLKESGTMGGPRDYN